MSYNDLLPDKKQKGLLNKIKNIFRSIFYRKNSLNPSIDHNLEKTSNEGSQVSFMEELKEKTDVKNAEERETLSYIVDKIEENPQLLEKLTTEQLENVNSYYTEKIEEVDKEIGKLKSKR